MQRKSIVLLAAVALFACKKNPHVSKSEIAQLAGVKVETILTQKKYQLDESASFEDVTLFEADGKTHLALFTPNEKGYLLLRSYNWSTKLVDPKLFFIAIGNKKSHVIVTHGAQEKTLNLFDTKTLFQEFNARNADTSSVKMTKTQEKPYDEILSLGKKDYRFNGIAWIPFVADEIFPYVETFSVAGEQSIIEIVNRGQFGTRVILTLAFVDATGSAATAKLRLTKEIPTVHLYKPGFPVHRSGGGSVALPHPLIEIHKDSWGKNTRIKLPLFMQDIQHLTLRAVYSQRGHNLEWPALEGAAIAKDGQGYLAVVK